MGSLVVGLTIVAVVVAILAQVAQAAWAILAWRAAQRPHREAPRRPVGSAWSGVGGPDGGVSILIPALNEGVVIADAVRNALTQDYDRFEVIVVSDGSTDDTVAQLVAAFDLTPDRLTPTADLATGEILGVWRSRRDQRLVVIDKRGGGGKAATTNAALNFASYPWVVVRDADELMAPDVLSRCMAAVEAQSRSVVAVGATLLPTQGVVLDGARVASCSISRNPWVACQTVEYLIAFFLARPALASLGALPFVSGGFGLFRRDALLAIDGFAPGHLGEDLDTCLRLHRWHLERGLDYVVLQVPAAVVWTEFPADRAQLRRQRLRWHRGLRAAIVDHRRMLRPRYRRAGIIGFGSLLVLEWVGALVEGAGWMVVLLLAIAGVLDGPTVLALVAMLTAASCATAATALGLLVAQLPQYRSPRTVLQLACWTVITALGYRQLTLWWRLRSLRGDGIEWGVMTRSGFQTGAATA